MQFSAKVQFHTDQVIQDVSPSNKGPLSLAHSAKKYLNKDREGKTRKKERWLQEKSPKHTFCLIYEPPESQTVGSHSS